MSSVQATSASTRRRGRFAPANASVELSVREYDLLLYLASNVDQVLPRQRILDEVWGYNFFGDENNIEVYVRYLRTKLGDTTHERIQTVRGVGYRLRSTVDGSDAAAR